MRRNDPSFGLPLSALSNPEKVNLVFVYLQESFSLLVREVRHWSFISLHTEYFECLKRLCHDTFAVFSSKLREYNSLSPLLVVHILL